MLSQTPFGFDSLFVAFVGVKRTSCRQSRSLMQSGAPTWRTAEPERRTKERTAFLCIRTKLLLRSRSTEVSRREKTLGREGWKRVRHMSRKFDRANLKSGRICK